MGNIFAVGLEFNYQPKKETFDYGFLSFILILLILLIATATFLIYTIRSRCLTRVRTRHTIAVIVLLFCLFLTTTESLPLSLKKSNSYSPIKHANFKPKANFRKLTKSLAVTSASLLYTAAFYFGLDLLGNYLLEEPELSAVILCSIVTTFLLLLILLTNLWSNRKRLLNRSTTSSHQPTIELTSNPSHSHSPLSNLDRPSSSL